MKPAKSKSLAVSRDGPEGKRLEAGREQPEEQTRPAKKDLAGRKIADLERQREVMMDQLAEANKALRATEEQFCDLFDEAPIAYVHERVDSKFIRANRAAMNILGITPEDVPSAFGKDLVPDTPDAQRRLREVLDAIGKGIEKSAAVLELRRKDNGKPLWIQWWSRPDPGGAFTRTMFLDITDRVLTAQERERLEAQNLYLQEEIRSEHNFVEIVGNSRPLLTVLEQVDQVAPTDTTTLILGETGTGKELIARAIHGQSLRREMPLVKVNCGAISAGLVESELFGHVKGAFTGALANRDGRFALANRGTIFLDEVGDLPLDTQVKLLRVLQEHEFEQVGGSRTIKVDVRVIAASNRDLSAMVRLGKFRGDLFYRLNVFPLTMPALRERPEDVPLLTMYFMEKFARKLGRKITHIAGETISRLRAYSWPGNIRELQNLVERAVVLTKGRVLRIEKGEFSGSPRLAPAIEAVGAPLAPSSPTAEARAPGASLQEVERRHIITVLTETNWKIEGERGAARILALQPSTLRSRMKKLGIRRQSV